jgi:DNA-binding MarR family transcriptional regulator
VLSKSGVTRLVTKLESEGLIERVTFPQDLRATFARLTPAGETLLQRSIPVLHRILDESFGAHLTPTELRTLSKTLQKVLDAHGWAPAQPCADWAHRAAGAPSAN